MTAAQAHERPTALLLLLAAVSLAMVAILLPFYGTLLWAMIIALLFSPLYRWLLRKLHGRRNSAALLTLLVVLLIVVLPFVLITMGLVNETGALVARLQSAELDPTAYFRKLFAALPDWVVRPLRSFGMADFDDLQRRLAQFFSQGGQFIAGQALRIGQNTFDLVASLFIMLYIAYFLIRDGDGLLRALRHAVPLNTQHQRDLAGRFATVIRATVKGNLFVAALQGVLGGLAFWYLEVNPALLWAVLMGLVSLLPAVGAALVWFPVALYLLSNGQLAQGVGLLVWGMVVIGLVDNLLRPLLVGKDTRLPDWVVLITTLGGIAVFGIHGFVLGPVIAAMFFALWQIAHARRSRNDASADAS